MTSRTTSLVTIPKPLKKLAGLLLAIFIVLQISNFIPPFNHTNPAISHTVAWDSPQTEQLMRESCYNCHSNETEWPWYSFIAPVSWFVTRDVKLGRDELNFSTGNNLEAGEIIESIQEGEMPPRVYIFTHPEAELTAEEQEILVAGVIATFGPEVRDEGEDDHDDDENEDDD